MGSSKKAAKAARKAAPKKPEPKSDKELSPEEFAILTDNLAGEMMTTPDHIFQEAKIVIDEVKQDSLKDKNAAKLILDVSKKHLSNLDQEAKLLDARIPQRSVGPSDANMTFLRGALSHLLDKSNFAIWCKAGWSPKVAVAKWMLMNRIVAMEQMKAKIAKLEKTLEDLTKQEQA